MQAPLNILYLCSLELLSESAFFEIPGTISASRLAREGPMLARICAVTISTLVFGTGIAWAACAPGQSRNCVNLDLVPQLSQQFAAGEQAATPTQRLPEAQAKKTYTGPIVGVSPTVRQTPTIGYRWSLE